MADRAKHIRSSFDAALYGLKNDVLMMSSLTDRVFQTAFEGLLKRDSELCDHVISGDEEIDILEKQVDRDGVSLLLRFHPVASDMREAVSATLGIINSYRYANRNVFVRPARGYGYTESSQQNQATAYVHPQQFYLGPGTPGKPPRWHQRP